MTATDGDPAGLGHIDFFDAAPDGILLVDDDGLIVRVNEQLGEMFRYDPAELIGAPLEILLPERFRARHVDFRKAYTVRPSQRPMGATLALFGRRRTGEEFAVDISLNSLRGPDGRRLVVAFVRDITDRRRIEQELRDSEEGFRLLVENVADTAIFMLDPGGHVMTWNPGAQRIKGWSADEILGRHFSVFYLPEDVATGQPDRDLERAAAEGRSHTENWRRRANGERFWAESTISAARDEHGTLRGFSKVTRDRTESRQSRARLEAVADLNRAVLEGRPEDDVVALVVTRARAMVGATLVAVWMPGSVPGALVAVNAQGDGATLVAGSTAGTDSIAAAVMRSGRAEIVTDLVADPRVPPQIVDAGMGSALFVPLRAGTDHLGVLGVYVARGRDRLQPHEIDLLQAFAPNAAASIAFGRARRDVEQLHLVSERERIARDLHDTVIQRLFAVGLALEATGRRPAAEVSERLHRAVGDIDDTIRAIRSSIFTLESRVEDPPTLRRRVLDVVGEEALALGFDPAVRFDGPVDTLVEPDVAEHLIATLREALSNVARHAAATEVTVAISAGDEIVLAVEDDGVGAPDFHRDGGHGVANMQGRAEQLGGRATVAARDPHGTRVEWRVPGSG